MTMPEVVCCPSGASPSPPYPGYSWKEKGTVDQVGDMEVYRTGSSPRCIVWCYDIYGFQGGRTRETCDKIAELGYMVIMPDWFRGDWRAVEAEDLGEWILKQTDWHGQRQIEWVEQILPYARDLGAEVFGVAGTCWGGYMVARLSSYGEFQAGVSFHPATSFITENVLKEKLYEILDEVQCPQLVLTAGDDHENEKPGGLANKVWGVMNFGESCQFREFPDMKHGWTVRGDVRDICVENCVRAALLALKGFFVTHIN